MKKVLTSFLTLLVSAHSIDAIATELTNPAEQPPNIVLIISDDMGRQDLSLYGSQLYETPNIDQLAQDGMRFDNAYVNHPRCVPSRKGLLSGKHSARLGSELIKRKHHLPPEEVTFAEQLKTAGYHTGYIGKWHLGKKDGGWPKHQGFDENILAGSAGAPDSYFYPWGFKSKNGKNTFGHVDGEKGEYLTDRMSQEATSFIERNKDKPFLLVLSHYSVHTPIQAKEEHIEYYRRKLNEMGVKPGGKQATHDIVKDPDGVSEYKTEQNHPVYAAMVGAVDHSVGLLTNKLKELDLEDNTIVIFTSDHGGLSSRGPNNRELATSNLPYRQGKGWLYDGGLRVPMIVKWPGITKAGSISEVQVTNTDHYATILQIGGLDLSPKHHVDGESYLEALKGKNYQRSPMFFHSPIPRPGSTGDTSSSAIIEGKWKLIHWFEADRYELFDISNDIGEKQNVAAQNPDIVQSLTEKLTAWLKEANAQYRKPGQVFKWDLTSEGKTQKRDFQW